MSGDVQVIAGKHDPRVARAFTWYVRRMMGKSFAGVRIARGSGAVLSACATTSPPLVIAMNHASWWDPLVGLVLAQGYVPARSGCAPIDLAMLEKFGFFKRLGLFGVDPDDARTLAPMTRYVLERFAQDSLPTLWITPQGRFTDVRDEVVLRPGAAHVIARAAREGMAPDVLAVRVEYAFWLEKLPEIFVLAERVPAPADPSRASGWQRALTEGLSGAGERLATLVRAREPGAFEDILGGTRAGVHPVMNAWLRLTGRNAGLVDRTRSAGQAGGERPGGAHA